MGDRKVVLVMSGVSGVSGGKKGKKKRKKDRAPKARCIQLIFVKRKREPQKRVQELDLGDNLRVNIGKYFGHVFWRLPCRLSCRLTCRSREEKDRYIKERVGMVLVRKGRECREGREAKTEEK